MLCALRRELKSVDESPYHKGNKISTGSNDGLVSPRQATADHRGVTTVELNRKDGSTLGLTISGGTDKGGIPTVSHLRPGGLASRSDQLNIGDYITSINGIHLARLRQEEIISLLKNIGDHIVLEVEYELPPAVRMVLKGGSLPPTALESSSSTISKTVDVRLCKEDNGFGFVLRGGFHEDWHKSRPLVVTYVRPGGPADREGTLHIGDRILSLDRVPMHKRTHADALSMLTRSGPDVLLQIEYDVLVGDEVSKEACPQLVEVKKSPGAELGLMFSSASVMDKQVIIIDKIKRASLADRCGALRVGDRILTINGTSTEHCTLLEATRLLTSTSNLVKLDILPCRPRDTVKVQRSERHHCWDPCVAYCHAQHPGQCRIPASQDHTQASVSLSPASTNTSGKSSQNPCAVTRPLPTLSPPPSGLPCPLLPTSPCSSLLSRRQRVKEHKSLLSLASTAVFPGGHIVHVETSEVTLLGDPQNGFGIQLQAGMFTTETVPVIRCMEPNSPAERCGLLLVGDRLLSVNGVSTEDHTLEEASQLLRDAALISHVTLGVEFDVAESVVPSSGTFHVKLPRKRGVNIGIGLRASKRPGHPLIISDIKKGSIAHRTGTLEPGDKLLAIDSVRLENMSVDNALQILQESDDLAFSRCSYPERHTKCCPGTELSDSIVYTVELKRYGGPLGITISGTEEPFDPITISGLTRRGLAERTGAIHVGDRILALNGVSLKGKPLSEAIHLLQVAGETVTLKIKKQTNANKEKKQTVLGDGLDDVHEVTNDQKSSQQLEAYFTTIPSLDSAMESWDGSGTSTDINYGDFGSHLRMGAVLEPDEWQRSKWRNSAPSSGGTKNPLCDGGFSAHEWEKQGQGLLHNENYLLSNKDELWCQALEDLETCGQSELLREIEASIMSGTVPSLNLDGLKKSDVKNNNVVTECENSWLSAHTEEESKADSSPVTFKLHKFTVMKDPEIMDFGFSISDGHVDSGIYVNMIRPEGPGDQAGLKPFDRILQVNHVRTRDLDCSLVVPLITEAGDKLDLVVSRNPLVQMTSGQEDCKSSATLLNSSKDERSVTDL